MFSANEKKVLKILGNKKMTINEIVDEFFTDQSAMPKYPNNNVTMYLRRIATKCRLWKLPWTIKSVGRGVNGKTVWREQL